MLLHLYLTSLRLGLAVFLLLFAYISNASNSPVTDERLKNADAEVDNWLTHGRTYDESRFSPLADINLSNVDKLGLQWSFEFPDNRGLQATPIVVDGVIYTVGAWSRVYALDAVSGKQLWHFDPKIDKSILVRGCCGPVSRGLAVWGDNVYLAAYDGHLIALHRDTGDVVWKTLTIDPDKDYTITGAPRIVNGNVIIGNGGAEMGVRGYVSAYDALTGNLNWRFYTVPGNPADGFESKALEEAAKTWSGEWWKQGGGGTVWDSMSYDAELNLLYIGVGNGSPWNRELRSPGGGDNWFLSSIVALNATTGEYVWHYQSTPGESWDYTATQQMILTDVQWKGEERKVIMQAPKNGFFFVLDRITGEFLSAEPITQVNWAKGYDEKGRPIEAEGVRYQDKRALLMPSGIGAHNWNPMSYHPKSGLVYIPVSKAPMEYEQPVDYKTYPHHFNIGVDIPIDIIIDQQFMLILKTRMLRGELLAWDPVKQQAAWRYQHSRIWNGGTLATAGDLVFQGTADQQFMAFNAYTGDVLWQQDIKLGVVAAPITYRVNGEQYVAVMAKWGGAIPLAVGLEPLPGLENGRLLVFKLEGKATLPEVIAKPYVPVKPPAMKLTDPEDLQEGKKLYVRYCSACHGNDVVGGGIVPDLRHMHAVKHDLFKAIVLDGALSANGMVGFSDVLNDEQAEKVQSYILSHAHIEYEIYHADGVLDKLKIVAYQLIADMFVLIADQSVPFFTALFAVWILLCFGMISLLRKLRK